MCGYFGTKKKSLCVGILEPKKIVLLNYPLGLSLLKYRNVWVFWNKKKSSSNRCSPLNSSIEAQIELNYREIFERERHGG